MLEMSLPRQQTGIYIHVYTRYQGVVNVRNVFTQTTDRYIYIYMYMHFTRVLETLEMSRNHCSLRHHNLVLVYVFD